MFFPSFSKPFLPWAMGYENWHGIISAGQNKEDKFVGYISFELCLLLFHFPYHWEVLHRADCALGRSRDWCMGTRSLGRSWPWFPAVPFVKMMLPHEEHLVQYRVSSFLPLPNVASTINSVHHSGQCLQSALSIQWEVQYLCCLTKPSIRNIKESFRNVCKPWQNYKKLQTVLGARNENN